MATEPSGLLSLPAEIRARVFTELLAARNVRFEKGNGYFDYAFQPSVLRVNKQLHREAVETLRHQNTFITVSTPWAEAEDHVASRGHVPLLIRGRQAEQFSHSRMLVEIDSPGQFLHTAAKTVFVISLEDLHDFCRMWQCSHLTHGTFNPFLRLTLRVQTLPAPSNPELPTRLARTAQAQLIAPFSMVKDLSELVITGPIEDSIKEDFYRRNEEPDASAEQCLDECDRLKEEGNKALAQKDYVRAKQLYEDAFEAMHILVSGRMRQIWAEPFFDKQLSAGRFNDQSGSMVRMILRIKLVANMIEVYLKLDQPEEAKFWGWRSINIMRENMGEEADRFKPNFPAAGAWGKVYFRTGRACQLLGEEDDARQLFRIAADWLPLDQVVQRARTQTALRL